MPTHLIDELDEGGPLDLYGAAVAVVEPDHEVEEVGLAQVGRRLLRELDPADVGTAWEKMFILMSTLLQVISDTCCDFRFVTKMDIVTISPVRFSDSTLLIDL